MMKLGRVSPNVATNVTTRSIHEFCHTAAVIPKSIPKV